MLAAEARGFNVTEALRDGTRATVRALRPDDLARMRAVYSRLSPETRYLRTFGYRQELSEAELRRLVEVDFERTVALVVTTGEPEAVVAGGRYIRSAADVAEIAFTVEDAWRGRGIASRVLTHLAAIARARGIRRFEAEVLAENGAMLSGFTRSGLAMERRRDGGVVHVELAL